MHAGMRTAEKASGGAVAFIALLISLVAACFMPAVAHADAPSITNDRTKATYTDIATAAAEAQSGDTILLGKGNYTLYKVSSEGHTKGKDLTFVGLGADETAWNIGALVPDPANFGTEYNGDYSFDGAGTVTFKNMTMRSGSADYLGFIRANKTVLDDCVVNGKTFYWGYESAEFTNTTFNAPEGDYSLWTYSSPIMTFNGCTFNCTGKAINVYTDYSAGSHDIIVNVNNCTFNSTSTAKTALNINDKNMGGFKYKVNITGSTAATGLDTDPFTCSSVFGFGGYAGSLKGQNSGRTDVTIDGELVWSGGKMLTHDYTDGEREGNYKDKNDYKWEQKEDGWYCTGQAECGYCGHSIEETVKADAADTTSCTEKGERVYTAIFTHECFKPQTKSELLDPLGHDWNEPTYTWNQEGDDWFCTATRVCKRDASHIEAETVKATYEVTAQATIEKEGAGLYTATFKNEAFEKQTKDAVIAKLPVNKDDKQDPSKIDNTKAPEAQPILPTTGDVNAFAIPLVLAVATAAAVLAFVALRRKSQR